jgi:hypothetical protein
MTGGFAAPATAGRMFWGEEETSSEIDRSRQDGIEVLVDAAEREDVQKDARVHASFGRSRIFPFQWLSQLAHQWDKDQL